MRNSLVTDHRVVALVGNPNVGKSSIFNALTGMRQHTGNWPGKTVEVAEGSYTYKGRRYLMTDLPGTYSLSAQSEEEQITVDYIDAGDPDCVVVVGDATGLEKNLKLALQVMLHTEHVILCVNLLDEAKRRQIDVDLEELERSLGIPVIGTSAVSGTGLSDLKETIRNMADGFVSTHPIKVQQDTIHKTAEELTSKVVKRNPCRDSRLADRIALGKWSGPCILLMLLLGIFWITVSGANYVSDWIAGGFNLVKEWLLPFTDHLPPMVSGALMDGVYTTVACVVSVMLPPMLIFFPLFSILEDLGYLPRAAFLADHCFEKCGTCGKQALTMAMGFGCNTVGIMGCRIISSPKERRIAVLTNALVPCNGRFPTVITLIMVFFSNHSFWSACILTGFILISMVMTMLSSKLLSRMMNDHSDSRFILELPPYRKPQIRRIIVRAFLDRTVFVLWRAIQIAAPAGLLIWLLKTVSVQGRCLLEYGAAILNPVGLIMGMNGAILLAFLLSFPANELFLPLSVMIMEGGNLETPTMGMIEHIFRNNGITAECALCMIFFTLLHWPCGPACSAIHKETGSWKWVIVGIMIPTVCGIMLCSIISGIL